MRRRARFLDMVSSAAWQAEIAALKKEVVRLRAERDILKKAAAYFAKEVL